jgi:hypothetical protein
VSYAMAVRTKRDEVVCRIKLVAISELRDRRDMVNLNEAHSSRAVNLAQVGIAGLANISMDRQSGRPGESQRHAFRTARSNYGATRQSKLEVPRLVNNGTRERISDSGAEGRCFPGASGEGHKNYAGFSS